MAEKKTIARPYAQAAFDLATAEKDLKGWSEMLQLIAAVTTDATMRDLISNPSISREKLVDLILDICDKNLNDQAKNFVRVLGENKRLNIVTEIASTYEQHRAEAEKVIEAEVVSAFALSDAQQKALSAALKKRLGSDINLVSKVDDTMIGGAIVRAGDLVIDGSVSTQLHKLSHALMS
ncbi:MAG: F0F1 ATP synthase subunit delta [Gammaproteobacteria bacterium]|nr:F0F1 ATP synthase subunit delta [Gammaproteobacteria bacterium]MDH5777204.1 F0F1 ATP synthase subunit delta [Gammaproteobacteria bacterium]